MTYASCSHAGPTGWKATAVRFPSRAEAWTSGEDAVAAAKREAKEELGVHVRLSRGAWGSSPRSISRPAASACIRSSAGPRSPLRLSRAKKKSRRCSRCPSVTCCCPSTRCEEMWDLRGAQVRVPYYAVGAHKVWGATAMMLCELLALLNDGMQTE